MDQCEQLSMEAVKCDKCQKKLVRWGSKRHKCQPHKKPISCKVCERIFKTIDEVKNHIADEHRNQQDKSKIICRYYKDGKCFKGDSCDYSHAGFVRNNSTPVTKSKSTQQATTC